MEHKREELSSQMKKDHSDGDKNRSNIQGHITNRRDSYYKRKYHKSKRSYSGFKRSYHKIDNNFNEGRNHNECYMKRRKSDPHRKTEQDQNDKDKYKHNRYYQRRNKSISRSRRRQDYSRRRRKYSDRSRRRNYKHDSRNGTDFTYKSRRGHNEDRYKHKDRSRSGSQCLKRALKRRGSFDYEEFHKREHLHDFSANEKPKQLPKQVKLRRTKRKFSYESKSSSSNSSYSSDKDLGHYKYKIGALLNNKYKIEEFLGDGTFGRVLDCRNVLDNQRYAVKVIRPVQRYVESARIEAEILEDILRKDEADQSHCVKMYEWFEFTDCGKKYIALVFEKLSKSLYDFIKINKYKGYPISAIQQFARQIFEGIAFLHDTLGLTHTDLKPENLLLKTSGSDFVKHRDSWPKHVKLKEERARSTSSPSTRSYSKEPKEGPDCYHFPTDNTIKIIDFGGATYKTERHSDIINTRQYRAPEVILGCCEWDEKSDIWSIACILVELYTGELFFPTHDNEEHLALIEKICGPIPPWMAENSRREFTKLFHKDKSEDEIIQSGHRINFSKVNKRSDVEDAVKTLETLNDIIHEDDKVFKDFLTTLLITDPTIRPSCKECLLHDFFKQDYSLNAN